MNMTTMEQPIDQQNKEIHVEDQTNLSLIVRRIQTQVSKMQMDHTEEVISLWRKNAHLRECHRSWQPEANLPEEGEAELTTVN